MLPSLYEYLLYLGDNTLILGHRNSEWCGHGPALELDIALTNISLDLIGQARLYYQYAASETAWQSEDTIAYLRDAHQFRNLLLVEQPNGDWAHTILRQFLFSSFQHHLYNYLRESSDPTIAAISNKSYKEVAYHLRWSSEWVIRMGDGTQESHQRMLTALEDLWMFTGEFFLPAPYEDQLPTGIQPLPAPLMQGFWMDRIKEVFSAAGLPVPASPGFQSGGKTGRHTEYLGYVLAEMQFLQRAYPGSNW